MVNGVRGSGQIIGEVHNQSDKTLTVKLADGSSKIILLGSSTLLIKSESFSLADISVGTKVRIFGQTNPDGSVTAQNIQIDPQIRVATPSALPSN